MTNHSRFSGVLLCCLFLVSGSLFAKADKPNILVIWGDDVGITNISAYSHGLMGYQTPNIDRIAKERCLVHRLLR